MELSRRKFMVIAAATASACMCMTNSAEGTTTAPSSGASPDVETGAVDAGPLTNYSTDDVYDAYRDKGLFVIRRDKEIFALSSVCTHKGCKVRVQNDLTFLCKCHGSRFDKDGKVTKGPAIQDLRRLPVAEDANQHLLIDPNRQLKS